MLEKIRNAIRSAINENRWPLSVQCICYTVCRRPWVLNCCVLRFERPNVAWIAVRCGESSFGAQDVGPILHASSAEETLPFMTAKRRPRRRTRKCPKRASAEWQSSQNRARLCLSARNPSFSSISLSPRFDSLLTLSISISFFLSTCLSLSSRCC